MKQQMMLLVDDALCQKRPLYTPLFQEFTILEAKGEAELRLLLAEHVIDVLVIQMMASPDTVFSYLHLLQQYPHCAHTATLVLLEQADEAVEVRLLDLAVDEIVHLPLSPRLLAHRIQGALARHGQALDVRTHMAAYQRMKLPFAVVKVEGNLAQYQYVNEAYAALSGQSVAQFLQKTKGINSPHFLTFLSEISLCDQATRRTFARGNAEKYYDVLAYKEREGIYSFTASENFEILRRVEQKMEYDYSLREMTAANPDTVGMVHVNVSRGICTSATGIKSQFPRMPYPMPYPEIVKQLGKRIRPQEQEKYEKFSNLHSILQDFQAGISQRKEHFFLRHPQGLVQWLAVYIKTNRNPQTNEIEALIYAVDESEKQISQQVMDTILKKGYDALFYIDLPKQEVKVFGLEGASAWSEGYPLDYVDDDLAKYLEASYVGEDKAQFIADNRLPAILERMQTKTSYVVDYRLQEGEEIHLKRGHYHWLDEDKRYLCFARTDITDSLRIEQKRSEELEAHVREARADERRQIQEKEAFMKQHYEEMREKDLMLTHMLSNIPGGIAIYKVMESGYQVIYASDGLFKLTGLHYHTETKTGGLENTQTLIAEHVHPDDRPAMEELIRQQVPIGAPFQISYRTLHVSGQYIWIMLSGTKIREEDGCPIYYTVYTTMPEQVAQYAELCENSPTSIHVVDLETSEIVFANQETRRIANMDTDLKGLICHKAICGLDKPCAFCCRKVANFEHFSERAVVLPSNGRHYTLKCKLMYWNARPVCIVYLIDETNFIREQEQRKRLSHAEEANKAKTEFLSRVSHDMRTPMNGILGLAMLAQEKTNTEELKQDMLQIQMSGKYLLNLINDTLDMNQIELGRLELHPAVFQGQDLVKNVLSNVYALAKKKGIFLDYNIHNVRWATLYVDAPRVEQIFINLISNAIKYTPTGGHVVISMENLTAPAGFVRDRYIIRDNGIGMSEDFLPQLFEPFSRENRINTDREVGTGLGMSIVKNLIDLMHGEITVKSQVGVGTEIQVILQHPIAEGANLTAQNSASDEGILQGKRMLLCEDHPLNASIATKLLEKKGILVDWVEDGLLGLERFAQSDIGTYALILMDIRMPNMDGLESTRAIRALDRPDAKTIPIMAMTANAFSVDELKSKEAGMDAHLAKPIDPKALYHTLVRLCEDRTAGKGGVHG